MTLAERMAAMRKAPWGCLSEGCPETRKTCAEMTTHMQVAHPELGITDCGCGR